MSLASLTTCKSGSACKKHFQEYRQPLLTWQNNSVAMALILMCGSSINELGEGGNKTGIG